MALQAVMDSLDAIPETYRDLYTEKGGKFELTGITGVKTTADIQRVQQALENERNAHKETRTKFEPFAELDPQDVLQKLDRLPELEAAAKGKLDDAAIEEIVSRRVDGTIKSKLSPIERQLQQTAKERDTFSTELQQLRSEKVQRTIHDKVGAALREAKVIEHARDDALIIAERIFEINEQGDVVTKDGVGLTPGLKASDWIQEIQAGGKRPHWWGPTVGGGANPGSGGATGDNPWSAENWNMTRQGQLIREKGMEFAERMAKAAGTKVGGRRPAKKA